MHLLYEQTQETPQARALAISTRTQKSLKFSLYDGLFAAISSTLTGGVFVTAFALALGANELHIGIIAAIPLVGNSFQFLGSYLVTRMGKRKPVCVRAAIGARSLWLVMAALPVGAMWLTGAQLILLSLLILAATHILAAVSSVAWLSWISDLVPQTHRGRFFGKRNMIIGAAVMSFTFLGGKYLDIADGTLAAFQALFGVAVIAGLISVRYLTLTPEPVVDIQPLRTPYLSTVLSPFRSTNFKYLLRFTMLWSFAVNIAAPFFVVYKLNELRLSFTYISVLVAITALFDLLGMRFWGSFSDRAGNRPVMLLCSLVITLLPVGWLWSTKSSTSVYILLPVLQMVGGFFWAGMNLTSANMLFRLAPRQGNTVYFSAYASINGLSAALAALTGGVLALRFSQVNIDFALFDLTGLKIIFLFSAVLRFLAIPILRKVQEPEGLSVIKSIQILRNIRSIHTTQGFNGLLHFFAPLKRDGQGVPTRKTES